MLVNARHDRFSGVVGKDVLLVAAEQQDGRHVSGQGVQPGHVEPCRAQALSRHRQGPKHQENDGKFKFCLCFGVEVSKGAGS